MGGLLVGSDDLPLDGNPGVSRRRRDVAVRRRVRVPRSSAAAPRSTCVHEGGSRCCVANGRLPRPADRSGSTGSPLSADGYAWLQRELGPDVWISPISGGTDSRARSSAAICTMPVYAGEMQGRCLGASVEAWTDEGVAVVGAGGRARVHEADAVDAAVLLERPRRRRYRDSYFDTFPGVWRHGDWIEITPRGGAIIYGRSDATINRDGIRMGTSELYSAVEALPEVADSLVVDLEYLGTRVVHAAVRRAARGRRARRRAAGPHHRRDPHGADAQARAERDSRGARRFRARCPARSSRCRSSGSCWASRSIAVVNVDAVANPASLDWYAAFARTREHS